MKTLLAVAPNPMDESDNQIDRRRSVMFIFPTASYHRSLAAWIWRIGGRFVLPPGVLFGVLAAFVASLGGHVATEKTGYRWTFYLSGAALAAVIITSGYRNYRATFATETPRQIVMEAVRQANEHSDKQTENVSKGVYGVNSRVEELSHKIDKNDSALTDAISKVSPVAPGHAKLQFSFFPENDAQIPVTTNYAPPGEGGYVSFDFTVKNVSEDTSAGKGDLWIQICKGCQYKNDPVGFAKRMGSDEHIRHKPFEYLNAQVMLEKTTVAVLPVLHERMSAEELPPHTIKMRHRAQCLLIHRVVPRGASRAHD
jgi:hypothetical protein